MQISVLAKRTGVSVHRLRRYADLGMILSERRDSGYREFSDAAIREVTFISMGRDLGLSLATLADALPRYRTGTLEIDEMIAVLQARIAEVDHSIAEQRALREKLVSHIDWFHARQTKMKAQAASSKPKRHTL